MRAQPSNAIYLVIVAVVVIVLLIIFLQLLRGISNYNLSSSTNFSSEIVKTTFTAYYCFSNNVCSKFNTASNSWYLSYAGSSGSALLNSSISFFSTKGNYTYNAPTLFLNGQYICPSSPTGQAKAGSNVSIYYGNQYCKFYDIEIYVSNLPSNINWSLSLVNSTSKLNYSYSGDKTLNFYALGGTQEDLEFYINNSNNSICHYKYSFSITLYPGQYVGSGSIVSFNDFVSSNQTIYAVANGYKICKAIVFEEKYVPPGNTWSVTFNGVTKSNNTGNPIVFNLSTSKALERATIGDYVNCTNESEVPGNTSYFLISYWKCETKFIQKGAPSFAFWSVNLNNVQASNLSENPILISYITNGSNKLKAKIENYDCIFSVNNTFLFDIYYINSWNCTTFIYSNISDYLYSFNSLSGHISVSNVNLQKLSQLVNNVSYLPSYFFSALYMLRYTNVTFSQSNVIYSPVFNYPQSTSIQQALSYLPSSFSVSQVRNQNNLSFQFSNSAFRIYALTLNLSGNYNFSFSCSNSGVAIHSLNSEWNILAPPPVILHVNNTEYVSNVIPTYFQLIINNTQNVATPNPFQQMINVSSSSPIWTYINTNQTSAFGQNVEFTYPNGTVIPSWLESYSSTHAIWWIKIGSIPANSKLTIYAKIAPKSTNLFNNKTTGEAPQLSTTYAQYDDGANVFLNYFPGYSLAGWTTAGTSGQTSSAPAGSPFGIKAFYALNSLGSYLYTVANGQSENMIIEYYTYINRLNDIYFLVNSGGAGQLARVGDGEAYGTHWYGIASTASWTSWNAPPDIGSWNNIWVLVGVVVHNGIAQMFLSTTLGNYGSELGQNPSNTYTVTNNGNYFGLVGDQQGTSYEYWNGIIIRAYPPNGVMPSVTFVKPTTKINFSVEVPLIINNTQNIATPNPFQQMINVSSSSPIWSYINTNQTSAFGQNVEFTYPNGTVIPSWLESYSTTHAIWWIKIGSIPANSGINIFMEIASKSSNLFNGVTVGEAPQLSPIYGEYNNIANVMNKGLLYQLYQVSGPASRSQVSIYQTDVYNAQLTPNSSFAYGGLTATAGPTLYHTNLSGHVSDVDGTNESNVILNYQYGYSGGISFPNPPISNPQYVVMKAIGWVEINSPTTFYVLTDDAYDVGYSNSGGDLIPWLGGTSNPNNVISAWYPQPATEHSGVISSPGVYRIELDYANFFELAYDAFWSNNTVTYYSPAYPPNGVMPTIRPEVRLHIYVSLNGIYQISPFANSSCSTNMTSQSDYFGIPMLSIGKVNGFLSVKNIFNNSNTNSLI